MELEERKSGLLVAKPRATPPPPPPPPPDPNKRRLGPLELQDDANRAKARQALLDLWDAMQISSGTGGITLPGSPGKEAYEAHYQLYRYVGEMLLGPDCPEKEILC